MFRNSCAVVVETCHLCCSSVFVIGGSKSSQDLQKNVCEIPVCPLHISRTHLLSINSSQLCVAKQITKGTLVSLLLRMSHITPHYISSEHGNFIYITDNVDAPLDQKSKENFVQTLPGKKVYVLFQNVW